MRRLLGLGLLMLACSSEPGASSAGGGGEASDGNASTSGNASSAGSGATTAGGHHTGGVGGSSGVQAGQGGVASAGTAGENQGGGPGTSGSGGAPPDSASGADAGGQAGEPANMAGAGGEALDPDPCDGVAAWDDSEVWTEYSQNDTRTLRGSLWRCQSPAFCTTYPGHASAPGWFKVAECANPSTGGEPACQCSTGECCDGCYLKPRSFFCGEELRSFSCQKSAGSCEIAGSGIRLDYWNLFCNGDGTQCSRWGSHTKYVDTTCNAGECIGGDDPGDIGVCQSCE